MKSDGPHGAASDKRELPLTPRRHGFEPLTPVVYSGGSVSLYHFTPWGDPTGEGYGFILMRAAASIVYTCPCTPSCMSIMGRRFGMFTSGSQRQKGVASYTPQAWFRALDSGGVLRWLRVSLSFHAMGRSYGGGLWFHPHESSCIDRVYMPVHTILHVDHGTRRFGMFTSGGHTTHQDSMTRPAFCVENTHAADRWDAVEDRASG